MWRLDSVAVLRKSPAGTMGMEWVQNCVVEHGNMTRHIGYHGHPMYPIPNPAILTFLTTWSRWSQTRKWGQQHSTPPPYKPNHYTCHSAIHSISIPSPKSCDDGQMMK